jgi:hypothetical protein
VGDEVISIDRSLPDGARMFVRERLVELADGRRVRLVRRLDDDPIDLPDGRWAAVDADLRHIYARIDQGRACWAYRHPQSFPSWEDALDVASRAQGMEHVEPGVGEQ